MGELELPCEVFDGLDVGSDVEVERSQVDVGCVELVIGQLKLVQGPIELILELREVKVDDVLGVGGDLGPE